MRDVTPYLTAGWSLDLRAAVERREDEVRLVLGFGGEPEEERVAASSGFGT